MSSWNELKDLCEKSTRFKNLTESNIKQYKSEIYRAKIFYENGRDLYEELLSKKDKIQKQYVIPYLLNFIDEVKDGELVQIQVENGASGGIDIDTDWQGDGREKIYNYLVEKYGKDQIVHVGTFSTLGPASAAKDILRVYGIDFGESNEFTKVLQKELSWDENLQTIQSQFPNQWRFYKKNQEILDLVPSFLDKIRQCLPYNQDVDIIDKYGQKTKKHIMQLNPIEDYIAYMDKNGNKQYTKNYDVFPSGKKKVYEIITNNGRTIRASAKHKFFLKNGTIKELKDLKKDDEIIVD